MFARIVEFTPHWDKREELTKTVKNQIVPILKKQMGFLEIMPFIPENRDEKVISITLWMEKKDAERYERDVFPKVHDILKPFLAAPITWKLYTVETTVCEHFVNALAA